MKFAIRLLSLFLILVNNLCYAQLMLRFQNCIDSRATLLGDVLMIKNDKHHWSALPLQSHPKAGETITKDRIINWMQQRLGTFSYDWQGKTRTQVKQLKQSSGALLLEKAKQALINQLGSQYTRVVIKPVSLPEDSEYALDHFKAEVKHTFPTAKRVCVWLTHKKLRIAVWFRVKAYAKVLVARHDLHYHTPIQSNAFSWKERNIAGLNEQPALTLPKNFWLKSSIAQGQILLASQLKEPPLVVQGQQVKVTVRNPGITIVIDGVALSDGYLGQTVTVKNPLNQNTFVATVSGLQQTEIIS